MDCTCYRPYCVCGHVENFHRAPDGKKRFCLISVPSGQPCNCHSPTTVYDGNYILYEHERWYIFGIRCPCEDYFPHCLREETATGITTQVC
jgi:hypothetical protein